MPSGLFFHFPKPASLISLDGVCLLRACGRLFGVVIPVKLPMYCFLILGRRKDEFVGIEYPFIFYLIEFDLNQ